MLHQLTSGEARVLALLFPHLNGLHLRQVEDLGGSVRIMARTRGGPAACHGCGTASAQVHDRYRRRLHDLPCGGRPVQVELEVRRLRCGHAACPVKTFAEQVPGVTQRHQRRTSGLRGLLERVALALAGRAGTRLAGVLGAMVSRFTLIRLIRALPDPEIGQVTVLGVDDFAKRRGYSYATVLLNMDSHRPADREAGTFAGWLKAHPGVQVICRDRAGAYAAGGREGAEALVPELAEPAGPAAPPPESDGFRDVCGRERRLVARHRERYAAVHARLAEGLSAAAISRDLGLDRHTVDRFARATSLEEVLVKATSRASILDPFKPYLNQRWNDGVTSAADLRAELRTQGWKGSVQAVRRYLRQFRPAGGAARPAGKAAPAAPVPPKPRQVIRWIMTRPDRLDAAGAARLAQITSRSPELRATAAHVREFAAMMTGRQGHRLDEWITSVRAGPLPALHSFAAGLERDHAAVLAGLTLSYSSGAVEGQVCKIKYLKRKMYGRANFDLLRRMALHN